MNTLYTYCVPKNDCSFNWVDLEEGPGEFSFHWKERTDKDGDIVYNLYCESNVKDKEFIKRMICLAIDEAEFIDAL